MELFDELDAVETGEKLLSGTYFVTCGCGGGFSSPVGLLRRSSVFRSFAEAASSFGDSSTSQVNIRMRSSSDVSGFCAFFLFELKSIEIYERFAKILANESNHIKRSNATYFGSYLMSDRRSAFRSIVRRMVSVSESL